MPGLHGGHDHLREFVDRARARHAVDAQEDDAYAIGTTPDGKAVFETVSLAPISI